MKKRTVHYLFSAILGFTLFSVVGTATAVIPNAVTNPDGTEEQRKWHEYYQKGYLVVSAYTGANNTNPAISTPKLQEAITDARDNNLALYLPAGTYFVNDTLRAYTSTTSSVISKITSDDTYPIAIVGATDVNGGRLATIKVAGTSFNSGKKIVLDFKNFETKTRANNAILNPAEENFRWEQPAGGYHQLLRNVNIDCSQKTGCVGLYFNQAQDSSIENVKVIATGSEHAGIQGLPARAAGAVKIEVEGGRFGIDTYLTEAAGCNVAGATGSCRSLGNIGSTIVGVKLRGQTESAIRHTGATLTVVGFEIDTLGQPVPGITTYRNSVAHAHVGSLALVDGSIAVSGTNPAVLNYGDRLGGAGGNETFVHMKNVYVKSAAVTHTLYASRSGTQISCGESCRGTGNAISHVKELSVEHRAQTTTVGGGHVINQIGAASPPEHVWKIGAANIPNDLISKHTWKSLPSVDDKDYVVFPAIESQTPENNYENKVYNLTVEQFNNAIDSNRKIFLRKGIYRLTSTQNDPSVKLKSDSILFGAAGHLTRIEVKVDASGIPDYFMNGCVGKNITCNRPVISTVADTEATTYLGDLSIGVPAKDQNYDYFTALDWNAGRNSMVHIGRFYHNPSGGELTNPHDLVKIGATGGGRWYFFSRGQSKGMSHRDYRILRATNNSQPLSFYGLNMEHADSAAFAEFTSASNIRIYGLKTEWEDKNDDTSGNLTDNDFLRFRNVNNVAVYGQTNFDRAPASGFSIIKFLDTGSTNFSVAQAIPDVSATGPFVLFAEGSSPDIQFPNGVGFYKKGEPNDALMEHNDIQQLQTTGYKPPRSTTGITWAGDGNGFESVVTNGTVNSSPLPADVVTAVAGAGNGVALDINSGSGDSTTNCGDPQHDVHHFSDFGFAIPSGRTIKGIEVKFRAKVSEGTPGGKLCVRLNDGSATWTEHTVGREKNLGDAYANYQIGGNGDLWGMSTFTPTVMNGTQFKIRISNVSPSPTQNFYLDELQVQVFYQ